ncbi:MAG: hypothetical protein ACYCSN_19070 [Acidobacteriaceae bacterium]
MKGILLASALAVATFATPAHAQFGGIVLDPTQAVHAAQQIIQGSQLYTTTVQTTQNVMAAYNLAQRMASAPSSLYTSYTSMGQQAWTQVTHPTNTYGNSLPWINAATTGNGAAAANQGASIQRTGQISGYSSLSAQGQQAIAAQGATADLGDAVNATSLQTLGTIRANAPQRETDIKTLEAASHSADPTQQTELATLQRINQAMLLQLRTQQEASQMTQAQSLQQMVQQKQQQDALKMSMQAADGYETNYASHTSTDTTGLNKAFSY